MLQLNLSTVKRSHRNFLHNHDRSFDFLLSEQVQTRKVQDHIKANAAFRSRTGNLVRKSVAKVSRNSNTVLVRISNAAPYAWAQDSGSGLYGPNRSKYLIAARRAQALRFVWKGHVVFRRFVLHPGVKPTHFLEVATAVSFRTTGIMLRQAMERAAKLF